MGILFGEGEELMGDTILLEVALEAERQGALAGARIIVLDEDVPGGASAYILQKILDEQSAYQYLDSAPRTLSAKDHRPAYGTDGDYSSKPSVEDVFDKVYELMQETNPNKFPKIY